MNPMKIVGPIQSDRQQNDLGITLGQQNHLGVTWSPLGTIASIASEQIQQVGNIIYIRALEDLHKR